MIFLSTDVSYSLHKKDSPNRLCRDWYSSDLLFASATVSPSLWAETWAQKCRGSCEGLHWVPGSAKPRPGPGRACCAADLAHRVDRATKGFGCTLCTGIHTYFVEHMVFLKSKVMAFCQEVFISLLTVFHGQCVGPGLQLDVSSWFQIVDVSHLRRGVSRHTERATQEVYYNQRSNFMYFLALDAKIT